MATFVDHLNRSRTSGAWQNLFELAVTHVVVNARGGLPPEKSRAAESLVKSAIRRGGNVVLPNVRCEVFLSDDEMVEFNAVYPVPSW